MQQVSVAAVNSSNTCYWFVLCPQTIHLSYLQNNYALFIAIKMRCLRCTSDTALQAKKKNHKRETSGLPIDNLDSLNIRIKEDVNEIPYLTKSCSFY